ncbi:MAG: 8-oxo-dGTP diphosphatase MutT [Porticoccaceae bacterium]|jgi:8-oxo-dGTP diphosphatase|nr:8-oxo-dGTP diphosphatase MutT [Porticoccaceae bacterium]
MPDINSLEVAVAVIMREGNVLLARRPEGKKHAGLWEFPGGKFEIGESLQQALSREIKEELGIKVRSCQALMDIGHQYEDYSVMLRVALVTEFSGTERGLEGQEIAWVPLRELDDLQFPEANTPILQKLQSLDF